MTNKLGWSIPAVVLSSSLALAGCGGGDATGAPAQGAKRTSHPLVGSAVPDFTAPSVNGKGKASVRPNEGRVLIVDFWATWCEPCKKSFPKLQDLYVKYKASGVEIVAVSEDDENEGIPSFGSSFGAKFPLVWDDGNRPLRSPRVPRRRGRRDRP
jgi:thiol-disulfide isomerase/thioredoxin